jgi:hypothetical protein
MATPRDRKRLPDRPSLAEEFSNPEIVRTAAIKQQVRDVAIMASLFFQHGGSPETLGHALTGDSSVCATVRKLLNIIFSEEMP